MLGVLPAGRNTATTSEQQLPTCQFPQRTKTKNDRGMILRGQRVHERAAI